MSTIKLDSKGSATCQITVKNVSRAAIDGRAVLVSLPIARPPAGAVEKKWLTIDGPADRHFAVDQEEVFSIKIAVPQKKGEPAPAGNYSFRLDLVNVARPDESSDQSQALGFAVVAAPPPKPTPWPLIAVVAALVLIIGVTAAWLMLRKPSTPAAPFAGTWTNNDPNTTSLTKLIITQDDDGVSVHPFYRCAPVDCDWGVQKGTASANTTALVSWKEGVVERSLSLQITSAGHLSSTLKTTTPQATTPRTTTETFQRQADGSTKGT
jgi:hypothetical protein